MSSARKSEPKAEALEPRSNSLELFHPAVRDWFEAVFPGATRPQEMGWPPIARGESTLILAPTGTGKTLAAFLWCINQLMFAPVPEKMRRCRVIYISPIKALAVDVERNLRAPLVGIAQAAKRARIPFHEPTVVVRTGDTPAAERARFLRAPADILITTPESLYLLLTSNAHESLRSVETLVIDEIHALVPTKRGAHLALSVERLEKLCRRKLQRIALSATQRPLEEVAHYLGGAEVTRRATDSPIAAKTEAAPATGDVAVVAADDAMLLDPEVGISAPAYRPVTIVDASAPKRLDLKVEVAVEDMARLDVIDPLPSGPASHGPTRPSIWSAIHPKLLELIKSHRSTLLFVNSRRLAERISGAINELAGETLVCAHHGSVALAQRKDIEDRLKLGTLKGIVATSSLELGIDMGAIDLVIQIESPTSVASGMQRVGRANHRVDAVSPAVIFPKYRSDLVACAAITKAMYEGAVESVHFPRNPLDVLAQQLVAMVAMDPWDATDLYDAVRRSAPFATLSRPIFEGVLDMLSGRYPSEEFAELRPRITWDRLTHKITTREGAKRVAVINGGTIPDRGLYGVFLADAVKGARVGELDEEMVHESRAGDTIALGATTWRIENILHDRVIVSPAPGEPGKMPFWHGDAAGRPAEFGAKIGAMSRELLSLPRPVAFTKLSNEHSLDANAAENVLRYLEDQRDATHEIPSDQQIIIEVCRDEMGDRRVCVLTPFGSRVHAPWCMAVTAKLRDELGWDVESMWTDDGYVLRLPENEAPIESAMLLPTPVEMKELVLRQLGSTSMFAAKFREAASRALLLPRRRAGQRTPLWQQRKRAADLLAVAARFSSFPILLEAYRECVRDVFDLPALSGILAKIQRGEIRVSMLESEKPSPFAGSLLFGYIANYIYDGDAPLAERRAQALSIDQSQLEELLGDTDLRELLDPAALDEVEAALQSLEPEYRAQHADGVHDLLLKLGDLSDAELLARSASEDVARTVSDLVDARRAVRVRVTGEYRYIPVEYAARYRDALGTPLPPGLADVFLSSVDGALTEIIRRYARTHLPFTSAELGKRYGLAPEDVEPALRALHGQGKLLEGEFRPNGRHREWCDPEILKRIRQKSLARLRREIEPVEQRTFARFCARWQGVTAQRRGVNALLDAIESLQGAAILASELERDVLPARIADYRPGDIDALMAAGEVVWVGVEQVGDRDGRVALYLTESMPLLLAPRDGADVSAAPSERGQKIIDYLSQSGASFFSEIHTATGGGFPGDTTEALWQLVWSGYLTNDTFHPLRNLIRPADNKRARPELSDGRPGSPEFLSRMRSRTSRGGPAQGRWSLIKQRVAPQQNATEWSAAISQQLLVRYGIVMRETAAAENIPGGYNLIYPALRKMEESGWIRRGMFISEMGAAQFALPAAVDILRSLRAESATPEAVYLSATDPANPYGNLLAWPRGNESDASTATADNNAAAEQQPMMARASGAGVILIDGTLGAFMRRRNPSMRVFLPDEEPERTHYAHELARKLAEIAIRRQSRHGGLLIGSINGGPASEHFMARFLEEAGFVSTMQGFQMRRASPIALPAPEQIELPEADEDDVAGVSETA
jgi:ATP-dependent Lhr-like helicase